MQWVGAGGSVRPGTPGRGSRPIGGENRQAREVDLSVLAGHRQSALAVLLLGKAIDVMVKGVVDPDDIFGLHDEAPSLRKVGIAQAVLLAGRVRGAEFCRPPGRVSFRDPPIRLSGKALTNLMAQVIYPSLQGLVERVAQHQHATLHPLARAAELGMRKHRHLAIAVGHGRDHMGNSVMTETVALREFVDGRESSATG